MFIVCWLLAVCCWLYVGVVVRRGVLFVVYDCLLRVVSDRCLFADCWYDALVVVVVCCLFVVVRCCSALAACCLLLFGAVSR